MEGKYDFTVIYSTERDILALSGLFPQRIATCWNWKLVLHLFAAIYLAVTMTMAIDFSNIADIIEPLVFLVTFIGYIFKSFCLLWKGHLLLKIEDILRKAQMMKCSDEEKEIVTSKLKGVSNVANLQRCFIVTYSVVNITVMPLYAIFKGKERYLPYNLWSIYGLDVNLYFYGSIIYQMLTVVISAMNHAGMDIVCYKLCRIICCQMDLFAKRARQLDYQKGSAIPLLKSLIQHHYEIMHLVRTLDDMFSSISFIQCISSGLAICFVGFQLMVTIEPGSPEFVSQAVYFCGMFIQIYFYCWYGQNVVLKSIEISNSYYSTNWYNTYSSNIRSYLFLIMERTKRPLTLRAGGVFPLSLNTLMSILRSSYSYMAVLQTLNNNKQ